MEILRCEHYHVEPFDAKVGRRPVITMLEVRTLARVDRLVEIEVEAFIGSYPTSRLTEHRRI